MVDGIAFIVDIEASGLHGGGFPIEIAWSSVDGCRAGSALIRPDADWDPGSWDDLAEAVHGISLDRIMKNGVPSYQVAAEFLDAVASAELFSDAHLHDSAWLRMLIEEHWPPVFVPEVWDIRRLIDESSQDRFETLLTRAPRCHRAVADVDLLRALVLQCRKA